jgi:hypothetical protein
VAVSVGTHAGTDVLAAARRLAAAIAAGALAGALVGGVGGRIAMLVLRLTSDPSLRGRLTDDGFTIGIVSSGTVFLIGLTTVLGAMGGTVYLLVRPWLPRRLRPWVFGGLTGLVGGASIIRPGGIDFTLLDPLPLAVAMFVAIPAAGGGAISLLAERFLRDDSRFHRSWGSLVLLVLVLPLGLIGLRGPVGFLALIAVGALILLVGWGPGLARLWSSTPVKWIGRAALAVVATRAGVELIRDITTIL